MLWVNKKKIKSNEDFKFDYKEIRRISSIPTTTMPDKIAYNTLKLDSTRPVPIPFGDFSQLQNKGKDKMLRIIISVFI
jgi:hypothetical protein